MSSDTHIAMHHEHRQWQQEASVWRDDLRIWQQEVVKAIADLREVENRLNDHFDHLRHHASAVRLHEMDTDEHEHSLVLYERGGVGEDLLVKAKDHSKEAARHADLEKAHGEIKLHHRRAMAAAKYFMNAVQELSKSLDGYVA